MPPKSFVANCCLATFLAFSCIVGHASAQPASTIGQVQPETELNQTVLTVRSKSTSEGAKEKSYTIQDLEALGGEVIETTTPWFDGVTKFEGVRLDKLLEGISGTTVETIALNDYVSEIPLEDFAKYGTIIAYKRNGAYMPIRDKGPLFIVYPYDKNPELKSQKFYSRSVWQVKSLVVK